MSKPTYKSLQKVIARDDKRGIESRWTYGQAVLADPKKMSSSGKSLRNGAAEALIADAKAVGTKLSIREIQWRLQCARTYKTIIQLRSSTSQFEDWTALVEAGFPSVEVDETPSPEELLAAIENGPAPDRMEFEQLGMFPDLVKSVPLAESTLRHLIAYAEEMASMTASYARRDEERRAHLNALCTAVGGDLDATYPEAVATLRAQEVLTS